jgi:transmembrane sensor
MPEPLESPSASDGRLDAAIVDQASEWLVKVWSGVATPEDLDACAHWRAEHADHERAWQRLQALEQKLETIPPQISSKTLSRRASLSRRRTLKSLGALLTGGAVVYVGGRSSTWQRYAADYQTDIGESRSIALADATEVMLNTASAIDVKFDAGQRRVELRAGEILVTTAPDPAPAARTFVVTTSQGNVRALGTRFIVRNVDADLSRVAVFEGAVLIQPKLSSAAPMRLAAGQQASFSSTTPYGVTAVDPSLSAWARGSLMVERMRLDDFIAELSRYRPGILRCDPAVGQHLLTGVYPLPDTDRILASIATALPIRVVYRSRYWVTVTTR